MISAEVLRLTAALAHSVPDAALDVHFADGTHQRVSYAETDHLTPCQWRKVLLDVGGLEIGDELASVRLGGSFAHLTGGLYSRRWDGPDECWFATLLPPQAVQRTLRTCELDIDPAEVSVSIRPDGCLAVSCVRLRIDDQALVGHLPEIAFGAHNVCVVEELLAEVAGVAPFRRPGRQTSVDEPN